MHRLSPNSWPHRDSLGSFIPRCATSSAPAGLPAPPTRLALKAAPAAMQGWSLPSPATMQNAQHCAILCLVPATATCCGWAEPSDLSVAAGRTQTALSGGICKCVPKEPGRKTKSQRVVQLHTMALKPFPTSVLTTATPQDQAREVFLLKASEICSLFLQEFWSVTGIQANSTTLLPEGASTDMGYQGESRFMGICKHCAPKNGLWAPMAGWPHAPSKPQMPGKCLVEKITPHHAASMARSLPLGPVTIPAGAYEGLAPLLSASKSLSERLPVGISKGRLALNARQGIFKHPPLGATEEGTQKTSCTLGQWSEDVLLPHCSLAMQGCGSCWQVCPNHKA